MTPQLTAIAGYAASVFIVLSFLLKDVQQIRFVNLLGCICFVVYGIYSGMLWPIIIPNAILCCIQLYHLVNGRK